ncbi:MAG: SDR family NAD(P)-dependent oxidoreductase [Actinomycetota bacterium]|jgi:NADP-dependent 3-hydroxy acid dehydrogenase YdfG|nr:SDR family NAD(P)-dependent oxidoreductase [Actinomycetota bacterium]
MTTSELQGATALVTRASSGFAEARAAALVAKGASVALAARRVSRVEEHAHRLANSTTVLVHHVDVPDERQVRGVLERAVAELGRIEMLRASDIAAAMALAVA